MPVFLVRVFVTFLIQGGPKVLEWLAKLELGVAGTIFRINPLKFQNQNNLESCINFEIFGAVSQKLCLPRIILVLLTVLILLGNPVLL